MLFWNLERLLLVIKSSIFLLLSLCVLGTKSQNLIQNHSFEDTIQGSSFHWVKNWKSPNQATPDYFTLSHPEIQGVPKNFAGYQEPRDSSSYMGLLIYSLYRNMNTMRAREYIQSKLIRPLIKDSSYCLQMYASLADSSIYASKGMLGLYFSAVEINSNDRFYLPYIPQIVVSPNDYIIEKNQWLKFEFLYVANGSEKYITIGNFNDIDVIDTIHISGGNQDFYQNTYYYLDKLYLGHCDSLPEDTSIGLVEFRSFMQEAKVYPNPSNGIVFTEVLESNQYDVEIYDNAGRVVLESRFTGMRSKFDLGVLDPGIYFIKILSDKKNYFQKVILRN